MRHLSAKCGQMLRRFCDFATQRLDGLNQRPAWTVRGIPFGRSTAFHAWFSQRTYVWKGCSRWESAGTADKAAWPARLFCESKRCRTVASQPTTA